MLNKSFKLNQTYHVWFNVFDKPYKEGLEADISSNFDYEIGKGGKKWVYIDIGLTLNYASVVYRTGFEFDNKKIAWKDIFVFDTITLLLQTAFTETQQGYKIFCEVNKLEVIGSCAIPETLTEPFANTIVEQYTVYRSVDDEENAYLIKTKIFDCEPGFETSLIFKYTFDILNEVLFYDSNFNNQHNREVFGEIVPLPRYATIQHNCKPIEYQKISLSGYDTIMFFQCLDCAMQTLLGDKGNSIITYLEKQGFNAERQTAFFKSGTNQFSAFNKMLKESNARITNLENRVDWLKVIK